MNTESLQATDVLATLSDVLLSSDSDTARIAAAKVLLERLSPKEDDEAKKHEADERDAALAQARGLLAEFAALKLAVFRQQGELDSAGPPATDHAAGQLADMADHGGQGLGQDTVRG
jgi:hypothetical protein